MHLTPSLRALLLLSLNCCIFGHARTVSAGMVHDVSVGDNFFSPTTLTALTGDQVKWTWIGAIGHSTTSDTGLWDSGVIGNGSTFTETFNTAGFFPYRCTIHVPMVASITVNASGPTVQITFPGNNATFAAPAKFKLQATASVPNGTISKVAFSQGNTLLVNDTTSPYSVAVSNLAIGHYTFTAIATDNQNRKATNSIAVTVVRDTVRPTLSILKPSPLQRITNAVADVTVSGTASDNVSVTNVQVQINGGDWSSATTTNGFAKWSTLVPPVAGTNVVNAFATDYNGINSLTGRVRFVYVVTSTLTFVTNGVGGIGRDFKGNQLEVGRAYTMTAIPGAEQVFESWDVGSLVSSSPNLTFIMQSNLVITANFIPNPFVSAQGRYRGLFSEPVRAQQRSGLFSMALTDQGGYSASLTRGTNVFPFSGQFDISGVATNTVNGWQVSMNLNFSGTGKLTGTVGTANWMADLLANHCTFNAANNPATAFKGAYTVIVPGAAGSTTLPAGHGYAALTISPGGGLSMAGTLADNAAWSQAVPLSADGQWACYASLYGGLGSIWGFLLFDTNQPVTQIGGTLDWIRPAIAGGRYPAGFTNDTALVGARYTTPTNSAPVIALTDGLVAFADGNVSGPFTNLISFGPGNRVTNLSANSLTMSIVRSNGLFSGSVKVPDAARTNNYKGAFLQDSATGYGFFQGPSLNGSVFVGPQP